MTRKVTGGDAIEKLRRVHGFDGAVALGEQALLALSGNAKGKPKKQAEDILDALVKLASNIHGPVPQFDANVPSSIVSHLANTQKPEKVTLNAAQGQSLELFLKRSIRGGFALGEIAQAARAMTSKTIAGPRKGNYAMHLRSLIKDQFIKHQIDATQQYGVDQINTYEF